jgi:lipoprotein-anchoring transpeptidase ErfK/SrfK
MSYQVSAKQSPQRTASSRMVRDSQGVVVVGLIIVLLLTLVASSAYCVWVFLQRTERLYRGYIYPHVYALGIDLGGMSQQAAQQALRDIAGYVDPGVVTFSDDERKWTYQWTEAGAYVDVTEMAQLAYGVGRDGNWWDQLQVWLNYFDVQPRYGFEERTARTLLTEISMEISYPAIQPTIQLVDGNVMVIPGEPGIVLDVDSTLERLRAVSRTAYQLEIPLQLSVIDPTQPPDTGAVTAQAEQLLQRQLTIAAYDVLTEQTLSWILDRDEIATWLYLVPGRDGAPIVDVNKHKIHETLVKLTELMGDGRGFRYDEAEQQIWEAFIAEQPAVYVYLTHPERTYAVQAGDTLNRIAGRFGIPPGRVAEVNQDIDIDHLSIGQVIRIPSQDIVTPFMPVFWKKIVVSLAEQRVRVYENGVLIWDWITSTGMSDSPTANGVFQVIEKVDRAYASQWDLWMPYFIGVYDAGGTIVNGFHELPILSNGQRLWAGSLGRPASFGCIILGIPEAETLYNWAEIGVVVVIQ